MISHFIKRDFKSNIFVWIVFGIITLVVAVAAIFSPSFRVAAVFIFCYLYFILATVPIQGITGAKLRTQHVMSRNYLLSLPVNRRRQFAIIQLRALVYWIPLILVVLSLPFISFVEEFERIRQINLLLYPVLLISSILWIINRIVSLQITMEEITSYQTQRQRFIRWVGPIILFLTEIAAVGFSWVGFFNFNGLWNFAIVMVVLGLAVWRYQAAKKGWLYQQ
jgi:hypothetical protein